MGLRDLTWFDVLRRNAGLWPDGTALVFEGGRTSHGALHEDVLRVAGSLGAAGLGPGDRLAVLAQNRPEILVLLGAAARLGAILVPVNWRLSPDEVVAVLADVSPTVVIGDAAGLALAAGARNSLSPGARWFSLDRSAPGDDGGDDVLPTAGFPPLPEEPAADAPLVIIHTAAVDGRPRGAVLSHANLLAHNLQLAAAWSLGPADVALGCLPLFHVSGLGLATAVGQAGGATVVMPRFDAPAAAAAIAAERVTVFCEFAPMLGHVLDAAAGSEASLGSLRAVWGLDSPDTIDRFEAACPSARFWSGYGQSETSAFVSFGPYRERPGTAGRPAPLARLAVLDEDDRELPAGEVGEIGVRGPLVFQGYWGLPEETAWCFRGGWHHTGDLGRIDEAGHLVYAGRSPTKELIKTGGENVYPAEVERALRAHPAVAEAVVIGVPDPRWGESVKAICERRPGQDLDGAGLIAFVGEQIARFKRPKTVVLVDRLPRLPSGAPDRARVKAEHGGG